MEGRSRSSDRSSRWGLDVQASGYVAERSRWPLVEGGRSEQKKGEEGSSFFRSTRRKMGRGSWFFRPRKSEMGKFLVLGPGRSKNPSSKNLPPIFEEVAPPPFLSSVRSLIHSSGPKTEDGGFFELRRRRSKIEDGEELFDLLLRGSKKGGLRSSGPEDRRRMPPKGFRGERNQTPNPFREGGLKPENRKGFRFGLKGSLNPLETPL